MENFFREARAAAKLSHPSIVMAFDAGESEEGIYFFAMELINGESLDFRVMRQGPPELKSALKIARDVAEGLEYAWRTQHLTHGDIKPANIILYPFGNAKIADLGLAKTAGEGYNGELMATPMFAAPRYAISISTGSASNPTCTPTPVRSISCSPVPPFDEDRYRKSNALPYQ